MSTVRESENWREENFKKIIEEKERERKRIAEQVKNSEYLITKKSVSRGVPRILPGGMHIFG